MTCPQCVGAADFFDEKVARRELKRLRRKGPSSTTRHLLDALAPDVSGRSVLDVGGGVGALQLGLLQAGAVRATNIDASSAYQAAARDEAERRNVDDRLTFRTGDVVELAPGIAAHDVVTLDRVLCCYPDLDALLDVTTARARRVWAAVFPRERLLVRIGGRLLNLVQRLRRHPFRLYLHGTERIEAGIRERGFRERSRTRTFLWEARIFERVEGSALAGDLDQEGAKPGEGRDRT